MRVQQPKELPAPPRPPPGRRGRRPAGRRGRPVSPPAGPAVPPAPAPAPSGHRSRRRGTPPSPPGAPAPPPQPIPRQASRAAPSAESGVPAPARPVSIGSPTASSAVARSPVFASQHLDQLIQVVRQHDRPVPRPADLDVERRLVGQRTVARIENRDHPVRRAPLRAANRRAPGIVDMPGAAGPPPAATSSARPSRTSRTRPRAIAATSARSPLISPRP